MQRMATVVPTLLLGLTSCSPHPSLPAAPSELATGLTIFADANYSGDSAHVPGSVPDLDRFSGPCWHTNHRGELVVDGWNDCISSLRIAPGWRAIVYRDADYRSTELEVTSDIPNLQLVPGDCPHDGMNDCISSIRVIAPG